MIPETLSFILTRSALQPVGRDWITTANISFHQVVWSATNLTVTDPTYMLGGEATPILPVTIAEEAYKDLMFDTGGWDPRRPVRPLEVR